MSLIQSYDTIQSILNGKDQIIDTLLETLTNAVSNKDISTIRAVIDAQRHDERLVTGMFLMQLAIADTMMKGVDKDDYPTIFGQDH
jgi:hypothetical protein